MAKRTKTQYVGVYTMEQKRTGGQGTELAYYVTFKRDGKTIEEPVGRQYRDGMTAAKASRIRADRIEGRREGPKEKRQREAAEKLAEAGRPTFNRLWTLYKECRPDLKGIVTDENRFQKHIAPTFGDKTPQDLCPLDVDRLRVKLGKTHAPGTVCNVLELLRRLCNFAADKQLTPLLSFRIRLPKLDNRRFEQLDDDQLKALLVALDNTPHVEVACVMRLCLFMGLRRMEALRLQWQDVDLTRGFARIRETKAGNSRECPISAPAREVFEFLLRVAPPGEPYLFPAGTRGTKGHRVELNKVARKILRQAGIPDDFRPCHGLRHSYASALACAGVPLYEIQRLLGHASPAMTQIYAHLSDQRLQESTNVFGRKVQQVEKEIAEGNASNITKLTKIRTKH